MAESIKIKLERLIDLARQASNKSELYQLMYSISHLFERLDDQLLFSLAKENNLSLRMIENVFYNQVFNQAVLSLLKKNEPEKLTANGIIVKTGLKLSVFILANLIEHISQEDAKDIAKNFYKILSDLFHYQEAKIKYTIENLCNELLASLGDKQNDDSENTEYYLDLERFYENSKMSIGLVSSMLIISRSADSLKNAFKKFLRNKKDFENTEKRFSLSAGLDKINKATKKNLLLRKIIPVNKIKYFDNFINNFDFRKNEVNAVYIIEMMTDGFSYQEGKTFLEIIIDKINSIDLLQEEINNYVKINLSAFSRQMNEADDDWSNKVYLISVKTLSALNAIKDAKDHHWIQNVFIYELFHWVDDIHKVLNKHDIEDDWHIIEPLVDQENNQVEWKSSFFTPTEQEFIDDKSEKQLQKKILSRIVKTIIAMMNTDGGTILVGLVENPQAIIRKDISTHLVVKNNLTFFDIDYEFKKKKKSLDHVKREIQDILFQETFQTAEKFNNLWSIVGLEIKADYKIAVIYKIDVRQSKKLIYNTKKEDEAFWVTLTKRADGRTIKVDPRDYLLGINEA